LESDSVVITRVHIENYRSIKQLDFYPRQYTVLVGENNAGKSNILKSLNLVLGETWPSERSFSDEDFFGHDTNNDIVIQVYFDSYWDEWRNKHKMTVAGFELRCHALQRRSGKKLRGELTVSYCCISDKGKLCEYPAEAGGYKGLWLPLRVSSEYRERLPFIYVGVLREYDKQNPSSRWSVLRKLLNEVNLEFLQDSKEVNVPQPDGSKAKMTRRRAFESAVKDAYKYLRTDKFVELETKLAQNVIDQMGVEPGEGSISLHFEAHDPTHAYKSLQLYVDQLGIASPATEVGAGLQSAIVVGIFRTYEEMKREGAIFAIEEPEVFLHPQKARYFEAVLQRIAQSGNQVLLSTHSPVFVRIHQPESVALVRRSAKGGTVVKHATKVELAENERKALRLLTEFDAQRDELFFARKVIFVEGNTEKVALPLAFEALGIDINKLGISVVECGGKTKLPLFMRVAEALEIPYVVLADNDICEIKPEWGEQRKKQEEADNAKHRTWNKEIEKACLKGKLFWLSPNFEAVLGLPANESEKIDRAIAMFIAIKKENIPGVLLAPIEALLKF
jgi:predicted ATP-dependent endonuclease of OLD family